MFGVYSILSMICLEYLLSETVNAKTPSFMYVWKNYIN